MTTDTTIRKTGVWPFIRRRAIHVTRAEAWRTIKNPAIDIIIPCHNEAPTLERNVERVKRYLAQHAPWNYTITIADSASTDETGSIATKLAQKYQDIRVVTANTKGRGVALKQAWLTSKADIVSYIDEDLSTDLRHLKELMQPLIDGQAAIGIGSRMRNDSDTSRGLKREIISRSYIGLVKRLLHLPVSDAQCGFKAMRDDAARQVLPLVQDDKWFFDTELLARVYDKGWTIYEVGVRWIEDTDSRVNIVQTAVEDLKGIDRLRRERAEFMTAERLGLIGLLAGTALLYVWNLSINGYANSYYAAAVQAASTSWHAFFYASLDSAGFVSVDKPPVAIWIMALFTRAFGFSGFTMLLPNALAAVVGTYLLYTMTRRLFSHQVALLTGVLFTLAPAVALMFRFNNPDSILTFLLIASAYTFMRALETSKLRWLIGTSAFIGLAFNTKMIQALIVVPIYALVYLYVAKPAWLIRLRDVAVAGVSTLVAALWWPLVVSITPASSRPYVGSTSDNSIWSLIFGYNGLSRFLGGQGQAGGGMGGGPNGGVGFGGATGFFRMLNSDFGPNIGWLLPLALVAALVMIIWYRGSERTNVKRGLVLVMAGWLVLHAAVFSMTGGTIHPYYVVVMAPAVAVLVGIGIPILWKQYKSGMQTQWLLPLGIFVTTLTAVTLLGYDSSWMQGLKWPILIIGMLATLVLVGQLIRPSVQLRTIGFSMAVIAVVLGPIAYTLATVSVTHSGSIPTAGLAATAMGGSNNESASTSSVLAEYLLTHQGSAIWIVAVASANESAGIQIATNQPVMAIGGFNGGDDTLTLAEFKQLVRSGQLKYFAVSSRGSMGGGPGGMNGSSSEIESWVTSAGTKVAYGGSDVTLYDLTQAV